MNGDPVQHRPASGQELDDGDEQRSRGHTLCHEPEAEARVSQDLARLGASIDGELGTSLTALVLLGVYARGEGSVIERAGELHADSCYELLAIVRSMDDGTAGRIERIAASWSERLNVDVHVTARTLRELEHAAPSLTCVDIAGGQLELIAGDAHVLGRLRALHPKDLPSEAWGAVLCDAACALADTNLDALGRARFGARALHQAVLACGDALLLQCARYAFGIEERLAELTRLLGSQRHSGFHNVQGAFGAHSFRGLRDAYAEALVALARPDRAAPNAADPALRASRLALLSRAHLALENKRVGTPLDPLAYGLFAERLWSDTGYLALRALRANLRSARSGSARHGRPGDPRERLARAAVLLAYAADRPEARRLAARLLDLHHDDLVTPDDVDLYVRLRELRDRVHETRVTDPLAGARYGR